MSGVNIAWAHRGANGRVDRAASKRGAEEMVQAFWIGRAGGAPQQDTARRAIDMSISWSGTLAIKNAAGQTVSIRGEPRTGARNSDLHRVGRTYGVIKLVNDPPHWSDNGH